MARLEFHEDEVELKVLYGTLSLRHLILEKDGRLVRTVRSGEKFVPYSTDDDAVSMLSELKLSAGESLTVEYLKA